VKLRNAVAIAEASRRGEVGEVEASEAATRKLVAKLAAKYDRLTFAYEAGPTGYGLYRLIESLGHTCIMAAPSLIPKKAGECVKTNRRDAEGLARLLRAGELIAVWVPDDRDEAMRELTRGRDAARQDLTRKRQQVFFKNPRLLMAYLGLVPSERSTGESVKRGSITKASNGRARRVLVEASWCYRQPPRAGYEKQAQVAAAGAEHARSRGRRR
jgi:transposase